VIDLYTAATPKQYGDIGSPNIILIYQFRPSGVYGIAEVRDLLGWRQELG
jgi:hypothetical protein